MNTAGGFGPLRNLRDIEDLERVPLEQRLLSWDVNDWIPVSYTHLTLPTILRV